MMDKIISCPSCKSDNLDNSVYCCQCGGPMREGIPVKPRKKQWISIILIALALSVLMTLGLQLFNSCRMVPADADKPEPAAPSAPAALSQTALPDAKPAAGDNPTVAPDRLHTPRKKKPEILLTVGQVAIINQDNRLVGTIPAAVINSTWIALPARACIGGNRWLFTTGKGEAVAIEEGHWKNGDAVGLWRLANEKKFPGPSFDKWQQDKPVRLLLFQSGKLSDEITLNTEGQEGLFAFSSLPKPMGPGIFLQNGRVVGWSFGETLQGAYMWTMTSDPGTPNTTSVLDFYNETFAGSREDYFARALAAAKNVSLQVQLQMFTEGFWFPTQLSPLDTPDYLRSEAVYPYIVNLVDYMMAQQRYNDIAALAEEPLLKELKNSALLINVTRAIKKVYGVEPAVNFIEGPGAEIQQSIKGATPHVDRLHAYLYFTWISDLLDNGDTIKGWQIFNRAGNRVKDSVEIHLLGVELALADQDWATAESLLYQKKYSPSFREKVVLLANRISKLKGVENKIVINFQPGSKEIPATATLNTALNHDFLIDTGASYVTIPYATIESLGLENDLSERQQRVQTAGGTVYANAVTLASIELQGWTVKNVQALVLDLPDRPGMGLLGLNFLEKFRVDLQSDEGILTLEPQ